MSDSKKNALIVIKKQGGEISFVIEDDGKGFDVKEAMGRDFTRRGMGLGAMEVRYSPIVKTKNGVF